jgi:hypothetical protein
MVKDGISETGREETLRAMDIAEIVALGLPKRETPVAASRPPTAGDHP